MASGHVNRANRPNTWLLRPMLQREDSSCQPGTVHTWPWLCKNAKYRNATRITFFSSFFEFSALASWGAKKVLDE